MGLLVFTFILTWNNPILGLLFSCMIILIVIHKTLKEILEELKRANHVTRSQAKLLARMAEVYLSRKPMSTVMSHGGAGGAGIN